MDNRDAATVRSLELGEGLRRAMEKINYSGQDMARILDCSQSTISRILTGNRNASEAFITAFLAVCRVERAERKRLMDLWEEASAPGWLQQHGSRLPMQLQTMIDLENKAVRYYNVQPILIPGLLQTSDYARAVIKRGVNFPIDELEDRVAARMARQDLFTNGHPPECTFFIHESVLYSQVGSSEVMSEQLHHLLRMSVRRYISIRLIPASLGAHAATAGAFVHMEFNMLKPITYLESETSSLFLEKQEETAAHQRILAALADTALDEGDSRQRIATVASELYADREAPDDHA